MPATPEDLFALLDRLGIAHETVSHPPLFTVEQSRRLRGTIPGGHTKNLFLRDKRGRVFLLSALEDAAIELKGLHQRVGAGRLSVGRAAVVPELSGLEAGAAAAAVADDVVRETTTQNFVKDVIEESRPRPVLVDLWAPWCGPCKQLTPALEKAVRAAKGKAKLVKMNIDEHPTIPGQMGIQSIPAVIAFVNGQPVDGFLGALPESQVTAFLERLVKDRVGGEDKDLLKAADAALAERDTAGAADLYAKILGQDPGNVAALAGLARCYV